MKEFSNYEQKTTKDIQKQIDLITERIKCSYVDKLEGRLPACMSDEEFNNMHREWQEEKDRLLMRLNECNVSSKFMHSRIDMILKFSEKLPELFLKGTVEEKKLIITTMANGVKQVGWAKWNVPTFIFNWWVCCRFTHPTQLDLECTSALIREFL